jgi:hypothetical protein
MLLQLQPLLLETKEIQPIILRRQLLQNGLQLISPERKTEEFCADGVLVAGDDLMVVESAR